MTFRKFFFKIEKAATKNVKLRAKQWYSRLDDKNKSILEKKKFLNLKDFAGKIVDLDVDLEELINQIQKSQYKFFAIFANLGIFCIPGAIDSKSETL